MLRGTRCGEAWGGVGKKNLQGEVAVLLGYREPGGGNDAESLKTVERRATSDEHHPVEEKKDVEGGELKSK